MRETSEARPQDDQGSSSTVDQAYRRYGSAVLRRAATLLGDEDLAWEVTHEVFLSLIERPDQYHARSSLFTWLYSATTHRCLNRLRNGRSRERILKHADVSGSRGWMPSPDIRVELERCLERLSPELAEVAIYFHVDRMTYDEIAAVTGYSRRKVAGLLQQLRKLGDPTEGSP